MLQVSEEVYNTMLEDDRRWAESVVQAVKNDPRPIVKYRDTRAVATLKETIESSAKLFPDNVAFYTKFEKGPYQAITYTQFLSDINALGTSLIEMGLKEQRIGVIGDTNYTWSVGHLAVSCGTGVVVPLDRELPYDDLKNLVNEAEITAVIFDKKREPMFTRMMAEGETGLKYLIAQQEHENKDVDADGKTLRVLSLWKLIEYGNALIAKGDTRFTKAQIDSRETAVIIFTSGTTGMAKGIMLSHRNFCSNLMVAHTVLQVKSTDVFFSVLPIHHTYEFTGSFMMPLFRGAAIAHCEGLKYIVKNIQEIHPTFVLAVPAIFEALHKQIWKGIKAKGMEEKARKGIKICRFARKFGIDLSDKFFKEVKETLGGRMHMFISGGAAINPAILEDFQAFGINAVQGYGLSECSPLGALSPDVAPKSNSCGVIFPSCEGRIDNPGPDGIGEICLKGDNIMLGYYKRPDLTAEAVIDGWFHTGDLGYMDKEGYVIITGRRKNVIITKNGKNVFPEELEYQLSLYDAIAESMVFEDSQTSKDDTMIYAAIYPDWELVKKELGPDAESNEAVEQYLMKFVDEVNEHNPGYKMIRKIVLRHTPFIKNTSNKIIRFREENKKAD